MSMTSRFTRGTLLQALLRSHCSSPRASRGSAVAGGFLLQVDADELLAAAQASTVPN